MTNKNTNVHSTNENKTTADFHHLPPPEKIKTTLLQKDKPKNTLSFSNKKFDFPPKNPVSQKHPTQHLKIDLKTNQILMVLKNQKNILKVLDNRGRTGPKSSSPSLVLCAPNI
ncbi:MAG: hypothetical protein WC796_03320 [Candidatus Pacearchaeota archaeon]|jgi:hypothetical protein